MNDGLALYLNLDMDRTEEEEIEKLIQRIDDLLLNFGVKYSGLGNMYIPVDMKDRDHAMFTACKVLQEVVWLKQLLASCALMHLTNVCPCASIRTWNMSPPSDRKWRYYEDYYKRTGKLAHPVIVDENRNIRDGYISLLLAQRYDVHPSIYEALAEQPVCKLAGGRHVFQSKTGWHAVSEKRYWWNYELDRPVVPGDILQVQTKKGTGYICVDRIENVTGREFCEEHAKVKRHTGLRMKEEKK